MAEQVTAALSGLAITLNAPKLNPELGSTSDSWILLIDAACSVWRPSSTGSQLVPLFSPGGDKLVPLASSRGLLFCRDKEKKRFLVGNPLTGAWKCIPGAFSDEDDDDEEDEEGEEEYDMCHEYDREGRIAEYRMLVDGSHYWIIGIAENNTGSWDNWEEMDLLYEYDSRTGVWRELDLLNYGQGHDCSVTKEQPKDLGSVTVLACSALYDPKRHVVHEIPDPEDAGFVEHWGSAVLCGPPTEQKLVVGSSGPENEVLLWVQSGTGCTELAKLTCDEPLSGGCRWYEGGDRYVTLSHDAGCCLAYDLVHQSWHKLGNGTTAVLHFTPNSTASP